MASAAAPWNCRRRRIGRRALELVETPHRPPRRWDSETAGDAASPRWTEPPGYGQSRRALELPETPGRERTAATPDKAAGHGQTPHRAAPNKEGYRL